MTFYEINDFLWDVSAALRRLSPSPLWGWAQIALGCWVLIGLIGQRSHNPRFQCAAMTCPLSVVTVLAGQTGLFLWGLLAALMVLDGVPMVVQGLTEHPMTPRPLALLMMFAFALVQLRVLHDVLVRRWYGAEDIQIPHPRDGPGDGV